MEGLPGAPGPFPFQRPGAPAGWRADPQNVPSPQTRGVTWRGGESACSGAEEAKRGRPAARSERPARFGSSPGQHTHPVPKGQQRLPHEGQVREMLGRVTEPGAAGSSSSLLRAGNHLGAEHLRRADPFSWEKQHKRQRGFSLSNTGLFTQANKPSESAETGGRF